MKYRESKGLVNTDTLKIVSIGCVAIVVALVVMSITSMTITSNAIVSKLKTSDLENMAASIGAIIEGRIDRAVDASLLMTQDPALIKWVQSGDLDPETGPLVQELMHRLVDEFGYDTAFLVSCVTHNYWSTDSAGFRLLDVVSTSDPDDSWFFTSIAMAKRYEINIDPNKELGDTFVWINVLVGDLHNPLAVAGLGMNLGAVIDDLITQESHIKNDIWLVDGHSVIQLAKNTEAIGQDVTSLLPSVLERDIAETMSSTYTIAQYTDKKNNTHDVAFKRIHNTNWKIVVQIPRSESLGFLKAVTTNTVISGAIILLLISVVFYLTANRIANPYKAALKLNEELERMVDERTRELVDKTTKLQDSIDYAKLIQQTILPSPANLDAVTDDYFVVFEPRDTVGGDFYWMRTLESGSLFVVGDCTGHGVPGALMTTAVNALLNNIIEQECDSPARLLTKLEQLLHQTFHNSRETIEAGLEIGVLFISHNKEILYSGAGMSLLVLEGNKVKEIRPSCHAIDSGILKREKTFDNTPVAYAKGIRLYLFTDGFTEQPGGDKHLPFGKNRLISALAASRHLEMGAQGLRILESYNEYTGRQLRRDDVTALGIKL